MIVFLLMILIYFKGGYANLLQVLQKIGANAYLEFQISAFLY